MKSMAFIDYQNFEACKADYLKNINKSLVNVNYSVLSKIINEKITLEPTLLKTYLFAYKPCDELLNNNYYKMYYNWLSGIKNKPFFEVIEGTQEVRPINSETEIDISDPSTFKTKEKGTDVNLTVHMLSKAYQNAYDVAILISGDTDYIPVVKELHHLGKIVVLATFQTQNISKYDEYKDAHINIDYNMLQACISGNKNATK